MFLEISQNSQDHTCARVFFSIKLRAWGLQLYSERDSGTGIFLWILQNFLEHLFYRTPLVAASEGSATVPKYTSIQTTTSWQYLSTKSLCDIKKNLHYLYTNRFHHDVYLAWCTQFHFFIAEKFMIWKEKYGNEIFSTTLLKNYWKYGYFY